jgi:hypothetical protein
VTKTGEAKVRLTDSPIAISSLTSPVQDKMAKGSRKKAKSQFKVGQQHTQPEFIKNTVPVKKVVRPVTHHSNGLHITDTGVLATCELDGELNTEHCILRPQKNGNTLDTLYSSYEKETPSENNLYALLHLEKTAQLFNHGFREHAKISCDGNLTWNYEGTRRRGVCKEMSLKCTKCNFHTARQKLYHHEKKSCKGEPAAAPNKSLQVALSRNGIGPVGLIDILHSLHMEAPSLSTLYSASSSVSEILVATNQEDMKDKIEEIKKVNESMGRERDIISIEADGRYNNAIGSGSGKTPFQAGTQATFIAAENVTDKKYIVHCGTYNKLCQSCSINSNHKTSSCCRTLNVHDTIGNEGKYFRNAVEDLTSQNCKVSQATLDGDSSANKEAEISGIAVNRCVRHLSQSLRQKLRTMKLNKNTFPTAKTEEQRKMLQKRLALDIALRCNAEASSIIKHNIGKKLAIKTAFKEATEYIINCYMGDCSGCLKKSNVCTRRKRWHRPYLQTIKEVLITWDLIELNEADFASMKKVISTRFFTKTFNTYQNYTTNKTEGTNRAILKSLPKHLTFSRCYPGRVHSAIHAVNNRPGISFLKLCHAVGATLPKKLNSRLKKSDERHSYIKKYKKSDICRQRLWQKREQLYKHYDNKKEGQHYKKFMADECNTEN